MKKITKQAVRGALVAFMAISTTHADKTPSNAKDIVQVDALQPDGAHNKIWQPFIVKWTNKHYLISYGLQLRGKVDMGDVVCSITKDKGKSWSPPIMIFNHRVPNGTVRYAYNNSVLFRSSSQDIIWCFAMRAPAHFRD
ncbi:uncharacterized protein METZ01_LOCUS115008, partial [marine metagenome]